MMFKTLTLVALSCAVLGSVQASAQPADENECEPCEALADLKIANTNLLSAVVVPATDKLPRHCRILGYIRPAINFEVVLPIDDWNGKFYMTGCGGYCGQIGSNTRGLRRHYATATMDSGHWGEWVFDGRWAYHNRVAEEDWAYRAVHETARVAKALIAAFYGRNPEKSYFSGCSTGGRMAAMEASKYPGDFDGIICGAPVLDYTGLCAPFAAWTVQANTDANGKNIIKAADLKAIQKAVLDACDDRDGLADGMIDDPRYCEFDPESLLRSPENPQGCLTRAQVQTLKKWYQGPRNSAGEQLYPGGLTLGSEGHWHWHTGESDDVKEDLYYLVCRDFLRYMAFQDDPGDSFDVADFDFDRDPPRLDYMARIYNAMNPNLEAFRKRGGKLLIYHGWGDGGVPPWRTIEYYGAVEKRMGSRKAAQDFVRLFMIPGMPHCSGEGYTFDTLSALETWVEQGKAPDTFRVTKKDKDGRVEWARDLYPYPMRTVYKGSGDPKDPSRYEGREP